MRESEAEGNGPNDGGIRRRVGKIRDRRFMYPILQHSFVKAALSKTLAYTSILTFFKPLRGTLKNDGKNE